MLGLQALGIEYGSLVLLLMLLGMLMTGLPLAFVTSFVALFFTFGWFGPHVIYMLSSRAFSFVTQYVFVSIPMFVLMASILEKSTIANDLFNAMRLIGGRLRGALGVQTLLVAIIMAAMSGIVGGETVLLGLLALPQMLRLGYHKNIAIGTTCAGGALGTMMPPSIVLIIYGLSANVSIADLFTGAFIPALILFSFYVCYVLTLAYLKPEYAPALPVEEQQHFTTQEKFRVLYRGLTIPAFLIIAVLGSIYGGIASVTEAAAVGVVGVMIGAFLRGEMNRKLMQESLVQTFQTCGMIIWIGIGATFLVGIYNLMGGLRFVENLLIQFGGGEPYVIILFMMFILFVLGMFLDWVGIALLTIPIFVPVIVKLGYDPIWFGVVFCMNMQVSFLSPPFGPGAFYLKSVAPAHITLKDIFIALLPFIALQIIALTLLLAFPQIVLWTL